MHWQFPPYVGFLVATIALSLVLAFIAWQRRPAPGAVPATILILAAAEWALMVTLEHTSVDFALKVWWVKASYIGSTLLPPIWLLLVLEYTGRTRWLKRQYVALLMIEPIITNVLVWTNEAHHLVWKSQSLQTIDNYIMLKITPGPWSWIDAIYGYILVMIGILFLIPLLRKRAPLYQGQALALILGALIPSMASIPYAFSARLFQYVDPTPFAFALSSLLIIGGILRLRLLDIIPAISGAVLESMSDAVIVLDTQNRIVDFNPAAEQLFSHLSTDMLGQPAEEVFTEPKALVECLCDGKRVRSELVMKEGDQKRYLDLQVSPIVEKEGEHIGRLAVFRDITESRKAEEALYKGRRTLHLVISSMPNMLLIVDEENRISAFFIPPQFPHLLDRSQLSAGRLLTDVAPPQMAENALAILETVRESETPRSFEHATEIDGQLYYFKVKVTPVMDSSDVLIVVDNITDLKQAEIAEREQRVLAEVLRDSAAALNSTLELEQVLDRILTSIGDVVAHDLANIMLVEGGVAHRVVRSQGYSKRLLEGAVNGTGEDFPIEETPTLKRMAETKQPLIVPDTQTDPDWVSTPETRWIRSYAGAPIQLDGEIIGFLNLDSGTPNAFTARQAERLQAFADQAAIAIQNARLYETLRQHAAELEARNRELDAFSHTVAHDLKTPLGGIIGYASLISALDLSQSNTEVLTYVRRIEDFANRMNQMIESLLLFAHLRHAEEATGRVDMGEVVRHTLSRFEQRIEEENVTIEVMPDLPPALGYGPWLEEVLANLVDNALKYMGKENPAPRIQIRGQREGDMVRYEVQDNGVGIAKEDQEYLFEMFTRFHQSQAKGLGLGLSIVLRIITKLQGKVGVKSEPGEGSTFWFTLPAVQEEA